MMRLSFPLPTSLAEAESSTSAAEPMFGVATTMPMAAPADHEGTPQTTRLSGGLEDEKEPVADDVSDYSDIISSPFKYFFLGLFFLVIPTAFFVWFGGVTWLRTKLGFNGKGKYKKVRGDDLEK